MISNHSHRILLAVAALAFAFALPVLAQTGPLISTVAGCCETTGGPGTQGYSGDGGPATSANLDLPYGVTVDAAGNFYIADTSNNVVRSVTASSGDIATAAGCCETTGGPGTAGFAGDGGAATAAELNQPTGVALDSSGNLYIADQINCVIREVAASTGFINTVAGTTTGAGTGANCSYGGDGGAATSAEMSFPIGIALDSAGNLYIVDIGNSVIREVTAATGVITTVAGTPGVSGYGGDGGPATSASLNNPNGVAVDSSGNLYIADKNNCIIREVVASTGVISTVAGTATGAGTGGNCGYGGDGGAATSALLGSPSGVAVDSSGNIYIADFGNSIIREVYAVTSVITTVAGTPGVAGYTGDGSPATSAELLDPSGIAVDLTGDFYIVDEGNEVIRKVTAAAGSGTITVLTSSTNPSIFGQAVTFTATVSGGTSPTGTVSFISNGSTIIGCSSTTLVSGVAQCVTSSLPIGNDAILATYSGDSNNAGSSGSLTQVVTSSGLMATATTVTSDLNPSTEGESVDFTATVTPAGSPGPTGTVAFTSNGSAVDCSPVTLSSGQAICTTSTLAVGTDSIVAVYSGDSTYQTSTSSPLSQTVNSSTTTPQLVVSASSTTVSIVGGQTGTVTLTVDVTGGTPSGLTSLDCTGLPADATCSLSPSSVTTYPTSVTMTITTTTSDAALRRKHDSPWATLALLLPGLFLLPAGIGGTRRAVWLTAGVVLLVILSLAGCGNFFVPEANGASETYTVDVSASNSGATSGAATISVTVTVPTD